MLSINQIKVWKSSNLDKLTSLRKLKSMGSSYKDLDDWIMMTSSEYQLTKMFFEELIKKVEHLERITE